MKIENLANGFLKTGTFIPVCKQLPLDRIYAPIPRALLCELSLPPEP